MQPIVFVDRRLPEEAEAYLRQYCELKTWKPEEQRNRDQLLTYLADAEGFLTSGSLINEQLIQAAPKLKVVSTMSVGYDHFDIEAMKRHNIVGTHTPYVLDNTVADLIFGLILSSARRITELDAYIRRGEWVGNEGRKLFGLDVHHQKLGIIGMGRIGEAVVKRAVHGFDMEVTYYNRSRKPELEEQYNINYSPLEELLQTSDFIVLMTPLTEQTKHMIGKKQFNMMKKDAIFINASRGQTIVEADLVEALMNGTIRGAGLDVFEQEPINPNHPLLKLNNVVLLPHIGSATEQTRNEMALRAVKNTIHFLLGNGTSHIVKELQ